MVWKNDQVSEKETQKLLELARGALAVDGDFVEFGCYKGDTSLLLAKLLKESVVKNTATPEKDSSKTVVKVTTQKKLYLYDSFAGLPEKSEKDTSSLGVDFKSGELGTTKRELKQRFLRANLKLPIIKKAWFKDLTEKDLPEKIAFAFLDGDFYDSIKTSLNLVYPRLSENSTIAIHDYYNPALPGVARAIDEFFQNKPAKITTYESLAVIRI